MSGPALQAQAHPLHEALSPDKLQGRIPSAALTRQGFAAQLRLTFHLLEIQLQLSLKPARPQLVGLPAHSSRSSTVCTRRAPSGQVIPISRLAVRFLSFPSGRRRWPGTLKPLMRTDSLRQESQVRGGGTNKERASPGAEAAGASWAGESSGKERKSRGGSQGRGQTA